MRQRCDPHPQLVATTIVAAFIYRRKYARGLTIDQSRYKCFVNNILLKKLFAIWNQLKGGIIYVLQVRHYVHDCTLQTLIIHVYLFSRLVETAKCDSGQHYVQDEQSNIGIQDFKIQRINSHSSQVQTSNKSIKLIILVNTSFANKTKIVRSSSENISHFLMMFHYCLVNSFNFMPQVARLREFAINRPIILSYGQR